MIRLVIDTATAACSVALLDGDRLLGDRHEIVGRGHAERLVPQIAELMATHAVRCDAILVDCGPGSFTGIRVGLAAARGLGLGWGVPVHGYSAMALLAAAAFADNGSLATVCAAITGGHGEIFVRRFSARPFMALDALASRTPAAAALVPDAIVVGSGAAALIAARGWGEALDGLTRAANARLLGTDWIALPPSPIYGRAPDAKIAAAA